jgi:NADPH-dependent glutamate synthase beta subunit-like oxidoreductase/NAD(P)H-flavin reductase
MTLNLNFDLSFEELYNLDGLRKVDGYFIEKLLKISPELCNKMLDARENHSALYKLDQSNLIVELAPFLEEFIIELFNIENSIAKYKDEYNSLEVINRCNKAIVQKHVMNLSREFDQSQVEIAKTNLTIYGITLPSDSQNILDEELDMAESFLEIYENSQSQEDIEWANYNRELLLHIENYTLWAIKTEEGQKLHSRGALFKVPKKLDYENLIPNLERRILSRVDNDNVTKIGKLLLWVMFTTNYTLPTTIERSIYVNSKTQLEVLEKSKRISQLIYCYTFLTFPKKIFHLELNKYPKDFTFILKYKPKRKFQPFKYQFEYLAIKDSDRRTRSTFQLNDNVPTKVQVLHEANYCLYCHKRGKDSCSHGLKSASGVRENQLKTKLNGCPLEQKISEMHLLFALGKVIGALATIVIDNPMVAATGHRICNDCMRSCIFQKQSPVDTPSVESAILKDVLNLPFGFEIYSLLTRWNPLNFSQTLPREIGNNKVMVVGMGPAGFTLAHYLLNEGVTVVAIDGLKIEQLPSDITGIDDNGNHCQFKPIESLKQVFEKLEARKPKGFGGVMEYGITVRWDKNMLDLIRLLLVRRVYFRLYDGVRFGSNINYKLANISGIDHIALAVGAGSPNIPEIKNILSRGVRMSSDFLMSLQLSGAYRINTIIPLQLRMPLVVIGAGLTAIDTATEAIQYYLVQIKKFLHQYSIVGDELFKNLNEEEIAIANEFLTHGRQLKKRRVPLNKLIDKWGGVTVLYRKKLQDSPAYRINYEELAKAFEEGIKFVEDAVPLEVIKDSFGHCKSILFVKDGKKTIIEAKSIIVATGTKPNTILNRESNIDGIENISYFGDADERYNGSVVKAMASAKNGYKRIIASLPSKKLVADDLDRKLISVVEKVERLTPTVVEVVIKSPGAAKGFNPGQFYRLQRYEENSNLVAGYNFPMEAIALTGANVKKDYISLIILELGLSTKLCETLNVGEKVVLMGPTGIATEIPSNKNILLIGGGLGNAVLTSIGKKMIKNGCKVTYFAGYKKFEDRFKPEAIEAAANRVIWCCDEGIFEPSRKSDMAFHGNMVEAINHYYKELNLSEIDHMVVIGSNKLMEAIAKLRKRKRIKCNGVASVNSPMNCMMKEICAQCIQRHIVNGKEIFVYSCSEQDQNIDTVDFKNLEDRLSQNSLLEKTSDIFYSKLKR